MTRAELINEIKTKKTFLCVGLDPDITKIPEFLLNEDDPIFEFNRQIIDATAPYCVAFKPNTAFYEAYGLSGYNSLEKTIKYIKLNFPNHFLIVDCYRLLFPLIRRPDSDLYVLSFFKTGFYKYVFY